MKILPMIFVFLPSFGILAESEVNEGMFDWEYGRGDLKIPSVLGGRPVVRIENGAFADGLMGFKSIDIPSTVTEIGVDAFVGMVKLSTVVAPASVQERFPNVFPHSPDVKWRRSRTPWVVGSLILLALLVFRKPLFHAITKKEYQK